MVLDRQEKKLKDSKKMPTERFEKNYFLICFQIYTGNDTQFRVSGLDARTEYAIRVSCVRVPSPGIELDGIFSPPGIFSTSAGESGVGSSSGKDNKTITTSKLGLFPHVRTTFKYNMLVWLEST